MEHKVCLDKEIDLRIQTAYEYKCSKQHRTHPETQFCGSCLHLKL